MAYVIRIAEKIDISIAIVVYLLNISNNQRNIGYDNGIFDDSYLLLIDWLKYFHNNFSTISINMGVEVLEYNNIEPKLLKDAAYINRCVYNLLVVALIRSKQISNNFEKQIILLNISKLY